MTNKKKRRRGKKDTSSSKEHNSRQEMRRADWLRLVAEREDPSRIRDGLRPQRDVDHQTNVRDVVRAEDTLFKQSWEYDTVDFGGQALNFSPSEREAQSALRQVRRKRPSSYWSKILYLDGAEGRQGERLDSDEYHQPEHHISGRPAGSQQVDPGFHPDRTVLVKQNLLDQVTEGLKATCVVSARSVADLLAHGFNVPRPPPPPPKADPGSQVQATSPPPIGALPNPFKQLSVFGSFAPPDQLTTPEAEAESPTKEDMSPGILIPRNAGIKLRSVEEEPPLVHVPAPDKSKIVVASQFLFQHDLEAAGMMDERNVQGRLQGIQVIEVGRRGLRMPMKTYGTACVFFMRYRYYAATKGAEDEAANRYDFRDAALASLWLASKAEETPKKSKEILCAFRNSTLPPEEHLAPDDEIFENQAKLMINLERYLLEIVAFDFRARNCGELLAGLMVELGATEKVVKIALAVALDIYRTLAVLKQTRQTLALSCLEMAARFVQIENDVGKATDAALYQRLGTTRQEVLETLFDLIELYLNHHVITAAGSRYNINDFMRVSTALRSEMKAKGYSRYTYLQELPPTTSPTTSPAHTDAKSTPTLLNTPRTPANRDSDRRDSTKKRPSPKDKEVEKILVDESDIEIGKPVSPPPGFLVAIAQANGNGTQSPTSPTSPTAVEATNPDDPSQVKEVVRFVLDASRARDEDLLRRPFHAIEEVEVTEHKDLWIPRDGSSKQVEMELATATPASPETTIPNSGAGKMRNGDVEMTDAPSTAPIGPRLRDVPPVGPRGERERDDRRERERERDERRDRERERRRTPPPPPSSSRLYGRDDRYGRRDERRW